MERSRSALLIAMAFAWCAWSADSALAQGRRADPAVTTAPAPLAGQATGLRPRPAAMPNLTCQVNSQFVGTASLLLGLYVENKGEAEAEDARLTLLVAKNGQKVEEKRYDFDLPPHDGKPLPPIQMGLGLGHHKVEIYAKVDIYNAIAESNEQDNLCSRDFEVSCDLGPSGCRTLDAAVTKTVLPPREQP